MLYKSALDGGVKAPTIYVPKPVAYIDKDSGEKIPDETIKLLHVQKNATVKHLIEYPKLYYAKSSFPLEISQRAFDHLWSCFE